MGKLSFIDKKMPIQKLAPPPKYFTKEFLLDKFALPQDVRDILYGFEFPENGGMICTN